MGDPVLHLLAGPNGAGKSTFYERVLEPVTHLPFINADLIAREDPSLDAYAAAAEAARRREELIAERRSFVTETVFSHESKVALVRAARDVGYLVSLHIVLIPEDLAPARVEARVRAGGHDVPEDKVRARFQRLWRHVGEAIGLVRDARVYDNSRAATPFRLIATFQDGRPVGEADWPAWTPDDLRAAAR